MNLLLHTTAKHSHNEVYKMKSGGILIPPFFIVLRKKFLDFFLRLNYTIDNKIVNIRLII